MNFSEKQLTELKQSISLWTTVVPELRKNGAEYKCCCPLHKENTPSFTVRQEGGVWLFHCFGCNADGNLLQFIQVRDNLSFEEAVKKVSSLVGWKQGKEKVNETFKETLAEEKEFIRFPLGKLEEAEANLANSEIGLAWLKLRGIGFETAVRFHIGFVQSAKAVNPNHEWVNDGWIVFPTFEKEVITLLKYRSIKGKRTPSGDSAILRKSGMETSLYNLKDIEPFDDLFIVEGEPDTMIMAQAGYRAVGYPMSTYTPTPEERDRIMQANTVFLAGDMDAAGQSAMTKLWNELRDRTYRISWPDGCKDANETFLKVCSGDVERFRELIEKLKHKALEIPMPHMYDLRETLYNADATRPLENPARLRFPWASIDKWTAVLPTDVLGLSATETGMGKTSWAMDILLHNVTQFGKIVVNYSAEISPEQYGRRAAACLTRTNKDQLTKENFTRAAEKLSNGKFYNGYKPGANYKEVIETLVWAKKRLGADILVLDHLHFLTRSERDEWKAQSEAMRMLKDLAVEYNIIVIVVGQPRKALSTQRHREAVTQDIKGSESFGADCSQIFILHRKRMPSTDDNNAPVFDPITKIILDKSRESETRSTRLMFDGATATFYELANRQEEGGDSE